MKVVLALPTSEVPTFNSPLAHFHFEPRVNFILLLLHIYSPTPWKQNYPDAHLILANAPLSFDKFKLSGGEIAER